MAHPLHISGPTVPLDSPRQNLHRGRRTHQVLAALGVCVLVAVTALGRPGDRDQPPPGDRPAGEPAQAVFSPPRRLAPVEPAAVAPVAGWLIDGAGQPVEGARVQVREPDGSLRPVAAESETDGAFRLDLGDRVDLTLLIDGDPVFPAEVRWQGAGPARVMVARKIAIVARVLAGGEPVAGAEVSISDGSAPVLANAITEADGVARFTDLAPGAYELWARGEDTASPLLRTFAGEDGSGAALELSLEDAGRIDLHVADEDGQPVAAPVMVTLVPVDLDHAMRRVPASADGHLLLDSVPYGRWRLEADAEGYIATGDQVVTVTERPAAVALHLRPAGVVSGTVVDDRGQPVASATLVLRGKGRGLRSHAARLPIERGRQLSAGRVRWIHPLAGARHMPIRDSRRFGAGRPGMRPAECGQGHCGVDIGTERGSVVHAAADGEVAHVVDWVHKEAGRYVVLEHPSGLRTFYMHLDDLRGDLEAGQTVRAGDPLGTLGRTGIINSGAHLHFAISQERDGRTWYIDPEPILQHAVVLPAARSLEVDPAAGPVLIAALQAGHAPDEPGAASPARFTTDERGQFRLEGVTPGRYVASAYHAELAPGVSEAFTVGTGRETDGVTIELSPGVVVSGQVRGHGGAIRGAAVVAQTGTGESAHRVARVFTDGDGRFELRALSGTITVSVRSDGHGSAERILALDQRGPARHQEDFDLAVEDAVLRGQVLDPRGFPAARVTLRVVEGPSLRRRVTTDAHGNFELLDIAPGDYQVELSSAAHPSSRTRLGTGDFARVVLEEGGRLALRLRDRQTQSPLSGITVEARGPGGRSRTLRTGSDGTAAVGPLVTGRWTLRARTAGYVAAEHAVEVGAGDPHEQLVELERGATLAGVVRDHNGQRVAGARVSIGTVSARSDQDGNFQLTDTPTGSVQVRAEQGGRQGSLAIELAPGDEYVTLQVDLGE